MLYIVIWQFYISYGLLPHKNDALFFNMLFLHSTKFQQIGALEQLQRLL